MKAGWERSPLGDACEFVRGPFGGALKKSIFKESGYAVYEQRNAIYNQFNDIRYFIDAAKFEEMSRFELQPNDIIMSCSGTMGKVAIVPKGISRGIINQALLKLTVKENLLTPYLNLWMGSPDFQDQLGLLTVGAAIKNVASVKNLKQIKIPLPSLEEQKRIVAVLDAAFEGLDRARAHTEANLQNARDLFESTLNSVVSDQLEKFPNANLSQLTESISDGDHAAPPKSSKGIPFITISNVDKNSLEIDFSSTFLVPKAYYDSLKVHRKPKIGDVLYTVTGSFGIPVHVQTDREFCFQRHIGLVRPSDELTSLWLFFLLMSPQVYKQANVGATGTAQRTVSLKLLRGFIVPRTPVHIQAGLTIYLDAQLEKSRSLASHYQSKLADLDDLGQSLLQKAFAGELT